MGLDISVYKAFRTDDKKLNYHNLNGTNYCYTLTEEGVKNIEKLPIGKFISKRINTYLDFKKTIVGYEDRYQWRGTSYGEEAIHTFEDLKHELHDLKVRICDSHNELDDEHVKLTSADKELIRKYGFKGHFKKKNAQGKSTYWPLWEFLYKAVEINLNEKDIPTFDMEESVLYGEKVGYQRKGLNGKFYDDYRDGKIGYFVFTKAELERYKDEYCDEPYEYVYSNGEKSGEMVYPKDNFQKNIINHFVEGEMFVTFDW